jgi:hypothetical protein
VVSLRKFAPIFLFALILTAVILAASAHPAAAETWLCPICQTQQIERAPSDSTLTCPQCKLTLSQADLRMSVAYLCVRTRPTEVVWNLVPECGIFKNDGLLASLLGKPIWVPWSAVDYYIPRQRILRLTSGEELGTPYAKGPECMEPPKFIVTVADSVGDFSKGYHVEMEPRDEELSAVFIVARSNAMRDSARVRFIREVDAGKHPRLPRSQPAGVRMSTPNVPPSAVHDSADVVLRVRLKETGIVLRVDRLKGSGNPDLDQAALMASYRSAMVVGGEMGVGVPCSMDLTFHFRNGLATVDAVPSKPPMWREWTEPKQ